MESLHKIMPQRLQRFQQVQDWQAGQNATHGYELTHGSDRSGALESSRSSSRLHVTSARDLEICAAVTSALVRSKCEGVPRILDFGGEFGQHFWRLKSALPNSKLDYTVLDLPKVVKMADPLPGGDLSFVAEVDGLQAHYDVAIASATVQYLEDPMGAINGLMNVATMVVLNRVPLFQIDQHRVAVQKKNFWSKSADYPSWFFSRTQFFEKLNIREDETWTFLNSQDKAYFEKTLTSFSCMVFPGRGFK